MLSCTVHSRRCDVKEDPSADDDGWQDARTGGVDDTEDGGGAKREGCDWRAVGEWHVKASVGRGPGQTGACVGWALSPHSLRR